MSLPLRGSASIQPRTMIRAHDSYILLLRESEQSVLPSAPLNRRILATSSADRSIKLWNMNTFDNMSKLIGHEVGVRGWSDG